MKSAKMLIMLTVLALASTANAWYQDEHHFVYNLSCKQELGRDKVLTAFYGLDAGRSALEGYRVSVIETNIKTGKSQLMENIPVKENIWEGRLNYTDSNHTLKLSFPWNGFGQMNIPGNLVLNHYEMGTKVEWNHLICNFNSDRISATLNHGTLKYISY